MKKPLKSLDRAIVAFGIGNSIAAKGRSDEEHGLPPPNYEADQDKVTDDFIEANNEECDMCHELSDTDEDYVYHMRDEEYSSSDMDNVFDIEHNVDDQNLESTIHVRELRKSNKQKEKVGGADKQGENSDGMDESDAPEEDDVVVDSGDDLQTKRDSDDEDDGTKFSMFNTENIFEPHIELGMVFSTKKELKTAIQSYAINVKRSIKFTKNDKIRLYAKCGDDGCKWLLRAHQVHKENCFEIYEFVKEHTCKADQAVDNVTSTWLAAKYKEKFLNDPGRDIAAFRLETIEELQVDITEIQAYKTKLKAKKLIEGEPKLQYELLWSFKEEILRSNPGSTVEIVTDGSDSRNRFDRIYICLNASKLGFMEGCRPVICMDGCWLKGPHGGILLAACGIDANNSYYPIAHAVVDIENADTWSWFMTLLKSDLKIEDTSLFTLMSDKQKGLIQAEEQVFPGAEYRFCARHLFVNFQSAGFRGAAYRKCFWRASKATTPNEFERNMDEMHKLDPKAEEWLRNRPARQWCRAYYREFSRCDILTNNACESFNSNILNAREKPILTMLQKIHEYLMVRRTKNRDIANKSRRWKDVLCPAIQKIIDDNVNKRIEYIVVKADHNNFQVTGIYNNTQFSVDLNRGTCGCKRWQLTGLPCIHTVAALSWSKYDVEPFTHKCYQVAMYKKAYALPIFPLQGKDEWPKSNMNTIHPPFYKRKGPGRPVQQRRLEIGEKASKGKKRKPRQLVTKGGVRLKRQQNSVQCGKCNKEGHNSRTCKQGAGGTENLADADAQQPTNESMMEDPQMGGDNVVLFSLESEDGFNACQLAENPEPQPLETEQTFVSWMNENSPLPIQTELSQSSVKMVMPTSFVSTTRGSSYADYSGEVPTIVKGGNKFITMKNLLKDESNKKMKKN